MSGHREIIAEYVCPRGGQVTELRCETCRVVLCEWRGVKIAELARVQREIRERWVEHATPAEGDYQI